MQKMLTLETNKYEIKINNFEGPLDLLCMLIEKNKMNINDINLSDISDQYITFINKMEDMNLEIASEFLIMASTLLYLKSKTLLPKREENENEEEITEDELINRIIQYKKYKDISNNLKENFSIYSNRVFKHQEIIELPKQTLEISYEEGIIPKIYENLINKNEKKINQNAKNIEKIAITETYTVASKLKDMFRELIRNKKFVFNKLFSVKNHNKQEIVTAFSGLLELSRRNKVETSQEENFGEIVVEKKKIKKDKVY